jgi:predicted Holliday junction resolvase-like endonuclease
MIDFFEMHRNIFGVCPQCKGLFRLSDSRVFLKTKPTPDWMDNLDKKNACLDRMEERIAEQEAELRAKAQERGRLQAQRTINKLDPIFHPMRLNPDDAKVIFHPVDFVVFDGMKLTKSAKRILLLDKATREVQQRALQRSIEKTIEKGNLDWETLRVNEDGKIERD